MTTPRKFLLSDAILLVAATAVGFAVFKPYQATMTPVDWTPVASGGSGFTGWIKGLWTCLVLASPFAMVWTLAVLILRLRHPRARWSRLLRQPGLIAGLVAALVLAYRLLGFATLYVRVHGQPNLSVWNVQNTGGGGYRSKWPRNYLLFDTDHFLNTMGMIGLAVACGWMLLLASGRWRPERSWIDRAGRVLGWYWIVILPLTGWWDFHLRF
jgi:hypothetical protein